MLFRSEITSIDQMDVPESVRKSLAQKCVTRSVVCLIGTGLTNTLARELLCDVVKDVIEARVGSQIEE